MSLNSHRTQLVLGTALWGWGIEKAEAFRILDTFLHHGDRFIDTAINYPINKDPIAYGLVVKWLHEWISINGHNLISIIMKLGAEKNDGTPAINLASSHLTNQLEFCQGLLGESLRVVGIHWDNRSNGDEYLISVTLNAMRSFATQGLELGLSGIRYPELYLRLAPDLADNWLIEVKENILTSEARARYIPYFPHAKYFAYGLNNGGIKAENFKPDSSIALRKINGSALLRQKLSQAFEKIVAKDARVINFNQLSLFYAHQNAGLSGIIIGPRNCQQAAETFDFWDTLTEYSHAKHYTV